MNPLRGFIISIKPQIMNTIYFMPLRGLKYNFNEATAWLHYFGQAAAWLDRNMYFPSKICVKHCKKVRKQTVSNINICNYLLYSPSSNIFNVASQHDDLLRLFLQ